MPSYSSGSETRQRLLLAASEVFAEQGYRHAKVQEICRRAGANVAAVNYHFGDKEQLYRAVIQHTLDDSEVETPHVNLSNDTPPEARLREFLRAFMKSMLGSGKPAYQGKLMANEMVEPTVALDLMVERVVLPITRELGALVRELLGTTATDEVVFLCTSSILSQCSAYYCYQPFFLRVNPSQQFDAESIEKLADHVARFSLEGLRALGRPQPQNTVAHAGDTE